MKEVSDKSGVMSDVVDQLLHWSLPAIRSEFEDGVASRIERTLPVSSRADVFRLGAGGDDSTAEAEDDGEREGEGSSGGNGGSFCGSDDSLPRSGHGSHRGRRLRGLPPSRGRSRSHFEHVRPLCWDDSKDGALRTGPCNNRSAHVLESMGHWEGSKAPDVVFVEPVKLLQLLGSFDLSCPRHGGGCAVDVSSLEHLGIEWQKDCHHKVKNIPKALRKVVTLKVPKKLNNPHQCVSESQFMQFTKELLDALTDRHGPGSLTVKEERLKKSDFVAFVMSKMYPYGTMKNNKSLVVDADGVNEFHMHEVGHWFLRASQLCKDEGGDFVTLHNDVMMIADHWAGDHSRGEDTIARDEDDVASSADPDVVGDDDVLITGDGDGLPGPADAVSD
ncbi:hypothetical protein CBR_g51414 [Chara braunii]|uniref:Uncharacterized protein n=1 Tax=Chara braunii TaxID=69332 RepID=A0A388M8J0_CHABU|nr:hypothetical protein CBR_g51414 [Chara braunii]|eukprot:GBG90907.1 hypothetical protein CBR_g51414 [Chara braunii]